MLRPVGCRAVYGYSVIFFTGLLGLIIYLFARPGGNIIRCQRCGNKRLQAKRRMPSLRTLLKKPRLWLAFVVLLSVALTADFHRNPANQVSARSYVLTVRAYQAFVSPRIRAYVRCRYCPSCSEYSIQAVEHYGLVKGLELTVTRLCRCTNGVPLGTCDPVPAERKDCCEVDLSNCTRPKPNTSIFSGSAR